MTLPITQKFVSPLEEPEVFLSQLERYTQRVNSAVSSAYRYSGEEQATASLYSINQETSFTVYQQTLSFTQTSTGTTVTIGLQSTTVVFLSLVGTSTIGGTTFPFGFNDSTNYFTGSITGNVLTTVCSPSFVGATVLLTIQYAYTG